MKCPECNSEISTDLSHCPACGAEIRITEAELVPSAPSPSQHHGGDSTGGVIPYKNPQALIAYYLGILSGLPLIGFPIGIAAFIFGIRGLQARNRNPQVKGSVHAGIGIGCGSIFAVLWGIAIAGMIFAFLDTR